MLRSSFVLAALAACGLIYCAHGASAATYNEVGDTGDLPATGQDVGNSIDRIVGTLINSAEVDLYKLTFTTGGLITFESRSLTSVPPVGTLADPNLFLFNSAGNPLAGDDDDLSNASTPGSGIRDSAFQRNLAAGTYYVAIGANNTNGRDAGAVIIVDNDFGVLNGAGVLASWITPGATTSGTYTILFSQLTVPEPSSLGLVGYAAAGLAAVSHRGRRRRQPT